jgi:phosphoribosylamine--glycine ligase
MGEAFVEVGKPVKMPCYVTSGDYVAVVTGLGETITGARRSAYSTVRKIKMPADPFYRPDIGAGRLVKDLPLVQKHGFAKGFKV